MERAARLVGRFYGEVWNQADAEVARESLAPRFRFRASLGPESIGVAPFMTYVSQVHEALAGYTCTIEDML